MARPERQVSWAFHLTAGLYGGRTSPVRVLSVVARALANDTSRMTSDRPATTFITGAAGFIGIELIKVLKARGHDVYGLTWSLERTAWQIARITRFWDRDYYRSYTEQPGQPAGYMSVQAEVTRA